MRLEAARYSQGSSLPRRLRHARAHAPEEMLNQAARRRIARQHAREKPTVRAHQIRLARRRVRTTGTRSRVAPSTHTNHSARRIAPVRYSRRSE